MTLFPPINERKYTQKYFQNGNAGDGQAILFRIAQNIKNQKWYTFFPCFQGGFGRRRKNVPHMYHFIFRSGTPFLPVFRGGWRCVPLVPHKSELSTYTRIHVKGGISYFFSRPRNMKKSGTCGTSSRERLKSGIFCVPHSNFYVVQKWYMWYAKWYISYLTGAL